MFAFGGKADIGPRTHRSGDGWSGLFRLGAPVGGRQRGEFLPVFCIDVATIASLVNGVEYYPHENTASGVNGIMPIETFVYEPIQRLGHRRRFP